MFRYCNSCSNSCNFAAGLVVDEASSILKYAHIRPLNASAVTIDCQFRDGAADTSCVLIYQANNVDDVLMVVEYSQNTDFPIVKTIDDPRNFTFAIFGKNSTHFDERPVVNGSEGNTGEYLILARLNTSFQQFLCFHIILPHCLSRARNKHLRNHYWNYCGCGRDRDRGCGYICSGGPLLLS